MNEYTISIHIHHIRWCWNLISWTMVFNPLELFILSSSWAPLNLIGSAKIEWLKLSSAWRVWNAFSDFLNYYYHCRYSQLHWSATELKLLGARRAPSFWNLGAQPNFWVHRAPVHPLISSPVFACSENRAKDMGKRLYDDRSDVIIT